MVVFMIYIGIQTAGRSWAQLLVLHLLIDRNLKGSETMSCENLAMPIVPSYNVENKGTALRMEKFIFRRTIED